MIKAFNHLRILIITGILAMACDKSEEFSAIQLKPKPSGLNAYLNVNIDGASYQLNDGTDGYKSALSYQFPADGHYGQSEFGSSIYNDSSTLEFRVGYTHQAKSREELVAILTKESQSISLGYFDDDGVFLIDKNGFLFEIIELEYPLGPGVGYSSHQEEQPVSSHFYINDYFAGEQNNSIWLKGNFDLKLCGGYSEKDILGEFFLEFPICCFSN